MSPRLAFALEAATYGGRVTLAHFQNGVSVDLKADSTPVTVADRGAEQLIRSLIEQAFPGESILGEEQGGDADVPDRWIIDPIDGTKSFISGVPLYSTLLSYERDYMPILGVVFFPALDEILYAEVGSGAFFNGRPARVSQTERLEGAVVCGGGLKTMLDQGRWDGFADITRRAMASRTWSDAYGHALVATGRVAAMVDPSVNLWDVSSIKVIIEEAGGKVSDFDGGPALNRQAKLEMLSSNGLVHSELVEAFRK
jgi:histidinol phosphatase-like enzyme (inositol monophosphatase family)